MATNSFGLEDAYGPVTAPFVPADRTSPAAVAKRTGVGPAVPPSEIEDDGTDEHLPVFKTLATQYGARITSTKRSVEENKRVGGVANSAHLTGGAGDFVVPDDKAQAFMDDARSRGYIVVDERKRTKGTGPHIHIQAPKGGIKKPVSSSDELPAGGSDTDKNKQAQAGQTFTLEDAYATPADVVLNAKVKGQEDNVLDTFIKRGKEFFVEEYGEGSVGTIPKSVVEAGVKTFQEIMGRVNNAPKKQERTPEEIDFMVDEYMDKLPMTFRTRGSEAWNREREILKQKFRYTGVMSSQEDADIVQADRAARGQEDALLNEETKDLPFLQGFVKSLANPIKNIMENSLPANVAGALANAPENERIRYNEMRQRLLESDVLANPDRYPASAVTAAKAAADERAAKQGEGIGATWTALQDAAKANPAKFSAALVNALTADPEMLAVPVGIGIKPLQAGRAASAMTKVTRLADGIIDGSITGATLNVGITAADQMANSTHLNSKELAFAGAAGGLIGGVFGGIFARGARAKVLDKDAARLNGTLDDILRDEAAYDATIESVVKGDTTATPDVQARINDMLGITSKTDRDKWIAQRRKEVKSTFKSESDYADYLAFQAEEKLRLSAEFAESQAAKADATRSSQVDAAFAEREAQKLRQFRDEHEAALRSADEAELEQLHQKALEENVDFDAVRKLDEDDIIEATFQKDVPAIARMLNSAERRDRSMRTPKWQKGEIDNDLAIRLGLSGTAAAAGVALAPEDHKMAGGVLGGLLGLFVPGGGRATVLSRMRQSGAVGADGNILGLVLKSAKLPDETAVISKAKSGDQAAYAELFTQYYPRLVRAARQYAKSGAKVGADPEDIAQTTMMKAFQNLDSFKGDAEFYTWLHSIMKNEGLQTVRAGDSRIQTTSMHPDVGDAGPGSARAGHIVEGGEQGLIKGNVEAAGALDDPQTIHTMTPEQTAQASEVERQLNHAIEKLPKKTRNVVILKEIEGWENAEIAKLLGVKEDIVRMELSRGRKLLAESVEKGYGAKRPYDQRGEVDPRLLKAGAVAALGAGAGAYLADENKKLGATIGALGGLGLMAGGRGGKSFGRNLIETADYGLGIVSTRIKNISEPLWRRAVEHERMVLRDTHQHMKAVDPFLLQLNALGKETKDLISRAILTGKAEVTDKLIRAIGDPSFTANWKAVRSTLDSLGDQLVHLKRFKRGGFEYFPRIVKDYAGLLKAMGKEQGTYLENIVRDADAKSLKERGTGLTDIERSKIINSAMLSDPKLGGQPGFAKQRGVQEITKELQSFYATPTESLHTYIRSAVEDIERAKFFGKDLEVVEKDGNLYTNTDKSIGALVDRLSREGKITPDGAEKLSSMLKSRFQNGERPPNEIIQKAKDLSYAGLLGNPFSAAAQLGDVIVQAYIQDIRSALSATVRSVTGRKYVSMKDFGLADHLAEEFVSTSRTANFVKGVFKAGLFTAIDRFGKDVGLNAAIIRSARLAKTERGIQQLHAKFGKTLQPGEFDQLVKDLQKGEPSDLVNSIAFAELSRTQPITRLELPQAYLDNPNGRLLYMFKSFMLKQMDVVRRDALDEIKAGHVARGVKNLAAFGITLGLAGATTAQVKNFMMGKDVDFKASDIPINMLKTFGMSEYVINQATGIDKDEAQAARDAGDKSVRAQKAEPLQAAIGVVMPPAKMFDEIVRADPKALRYIPLIGPKLLDMYKAKQEEEK